MEKKLKEDEETTITNEKNITTEDNIEDDDNITEEQVENKEIESIHFENEQLDNLEDDKNEISNMKEEEMPIFNTQEKVEDQKISNVKEEQKEYQQPSKSEQQKIKPIIIPVKNSEKENTIKSPRDLKVIVQKIVSPRYLEDSKLTKKMSMIEMMKTKLQNEAIKSTEKKDSPVPSEIGNEKGKILKMQNHFIEEIEKQNSPRPSLERKSSKINLEIKREKCNICDKTVYATEKMTAGKNIFHQKCFKCSRCKTNLTIQNYVISNEDEEIKLYCKVHYEEGLKSKDIFKKKYTELE
jgi:hypothetical protein